MAEPAMTLYQDLPEDMNNINKYLLFVIIWHGDDINRSPESEVGRDRGLRGGSYRERERERERESQHEL